MKKTLAILLALVVVGGAAFAQVTVTAKASGSVYLENGKGDGDVVSSLSPNGATYDVLKFAASKDDKYGFEVYDNNLFGGTTVDVDYWDVWYDIGFAKATLGALNGGSYVQYFNNGWIENYDPTDSISGKGLLVESKNLGGLTLGAFLPLAGTDALTTTYEKASIGASYAVEKVVTVNAQANLGLTDSSTNVNVGFDFTGVENLDAYGWANYAQGNTIAGGIGAQYKTDAYRIGAEFEAQDAADVLAFDAVANARYYVTPALFVQARGAYCNENTAYQGGVARIWGKGYVNYAFGNGFAVEGMVGYDTVPVVSKVAQKASLVQYLKLTYSISL